MEISARNAAVELGKAVPKDRYRVALIDDVIIVGAVRDRPAQHQEQNLAKRIGHVPSLPRILDLRGRDRVAAQPGWGCRKRKRILRHTRTNLLGSQTISPPCR
jgi:hypothetical protein